MNDATEPNRGQEGGHSPFPIGLLLTVIAAGAGAGVTSAWDTGVHAVAVVVILLIVTGSVRWRPGGGCLVALTAT